MVSRAPSSWSTALNDGKLASEPGEHAASRLAWLQELEKGARTQGSHLAVLLDLVGEHASESLSSTGVKPDAVVDAQVVRSPEVRPHRQIAENAARRSHGGLEPDRRQQRGQEHFLNGFAREPLTAALATGAWFFESADL